MLWQKFDATAPGLQLIERHTWIPSIGAEYVVGIDGLSLLLVLLTSLIFPFAFCAQKLERGACALMLVMQAALYGTFTAQNFVLWFLFYEMSLVPSFLLIKMYGDRRGGARLRGGQVLPLHLPRQRHDAAGVSRNLFCQRDIRFRCAGRPRQRRIDLRKFSLVRFRRNFSRSRRQGSAVPISHLAAGRLPNRADRSFDGVDWHAFENGRLRFHPITHPAFPERN